MKKTISFLVLSVLLICSIGLLACGGKSGETTTTTTSVPAVSTTTSTSPKTTTAASSGGLTWNDMPVYSGAGQIQKGSWAIPPSDDSDYSKFEWRYYESSVDFETVSNFYKSEMPSNGWTENGWFEVQNMKWGMYVKNDENDAAMVWINLQDDGKTVIAMWRATK